MIRNYFLLVIYCSFVSNTIAMDQSHQQFVQQKIVAYKQLRSSIASTNNFLMQQDLISQCIETAIKNLSIKSTHAYHEAAYVTALMDEIEKQFLSRNLSKNPNTNEHGYESLAQAHVFGLIFYKTPAIAAAFAAQYALEINKKNKKTQVTCAAIAHMVAQSLERKNHAVDDRDLIITNAIKRISNNSESYYDKIAADLNQNNVLADVVHYFMLSKDIQNQSDLLRLIQSIENPIMSYTVATLIGAYLEPIGISTNKDHFDTNTKITSKRNNSIKSSYCCTSFLILTIFLLILNSINDIY